MAAGNKPEAMKQRMITHYRGWLDHHKKSGCHYDQPEHDNWCDCDTIRVALDDLEESITPAYQYDQSEGQE